MMSLKSKNRFKQQSGFTLLEVLIAALLVGIITTAAFQFYVSLHTQTEKQYEQSEVQTLCRSTIFDIKKNLRMAGYRVGAHAPYAISGDSLSIYMNTSGTIDTVKYYLEEFQAWEYAAMEDFPSGKHLYRLMKQFNSDTPAIYSDYITAIRYTQIDASNIAVSIMAYTTRPDDNYQIDNGFRTFTVSDRVNLRNVG